MTNEQIRLLILMCCALENCTAPEELQHLSVSENIAIAGRRCQAR